MLRTGVTNSQVQQSDHRILTVDDFVITGYPFEGAHQLLRGLGSLSY